VGKVKRQVERVGRGGITPYSPFFHRSRTPPTLFQTPVPYSVAQTLAVGSRAEGNWMDITLRPRPLSLCIHQCVCVCVCQKTSSFSPSSSSCAYTHRAKHPLLDSHVNDRLSQCQKASSFFVVFSPPSFISSYRVEMGSSSHFFLLSFLPFFLSCLLLRRRRCRCCCWWWWYVLFRQASCFRVVCTIPDR